MAERRRRRLATGEDRDLWHRAMHDVAPLGERRPPPPLEASPAAIAPPAPRPDPNPVPILPVLPPLDRFAGIDRARVERLKRGRLQIEARLDLHGMTQAEAHRALAGFIAGGRAAGRRCVLVITGRGVAGGGVLRHAVPRWLDEPELRRHLLAVTAAQPRDGGNGALYLLLRRMPAEATLVGR